MVSNSEIKSLISILFFMINLIPHNIPKWLYLLNLKMLLGNASKNIHGSTQRKSQILEFGTFNNKT